jgi:DNA-binding NtrC family response regulator
MGGRLNIDADRPTSVHAGRSRNEQRGGGGARLAVVRGPGAGLRRIIGAEPLRIGKAPINHLCIPDPTVSRFHCVVEPTERGLLLRDLGSANGTQVGGCWVERAYLDLGVPIQLGNSVLELRAEEGAQAPANNQTAPGALGESLVMQRLRAMLPRLAQSGSTVLLAGETGTGKSLLAEMLHRAGPRAAAPFVVVDCGALPPSLIESELYGYERGAFTGANERRAGAFEAAQGGTVFLDEIGELPLEVQPKLLRALEERVIRRLGSTTPVRLNVQIIAATNRDLTQAVDRGTFRADLFYRLDALRMTVPPLRDRREDIPALVDHFCRKLQVPVTRDQRARMHSEFATRPWPGNVRELRNAVEQAVLLGDLDARRPLSSEDRDDTAVNGDPTRLEWDFSQPFRLAKDRSIERWERQYLTALMRHVNGNISRAARLVEVDRAHLRTLLRRHGVIS